MMQAALAVRFLVADANFDVVLAEHDKCASNGAMRVWRCKDGGAPAAHC